MDKIFASILALPSLLYLSYDYKNRQNFNKLLENGTDRNFSLKSGVVISKESLPNNNDFVNDSIIAKETITKLQTYHTHYHDLPIYSSNNIKIKIPIPETNIIWQTNSKYRKFANDIILSNNLDGYLYLDKETKIMWDKTNENINNNIVTIEKYLYNNVLRSIFGNNNDGNINVKYIGTEKYVTNKIRSDHYGINNWLTTIASVTLTLSTSWIVNSFVDSDRKTR